MKKKILIAPLNWGLGHATRCIPIINALIAQDFIPILASDGDALTLLQKEFPKLKSYQLPSYQISYSKGKNLKYKLFLSTPKILKAIQEEKKIIQKIVAKENLSGIISDNRFGVRNTKIPSVYITHQINVLSGNTTLISSKMHQRIIAKFDECWIPDDYRHTLSGKLSEVKHLKLTVKYLGVLSRLEKKKEANNYDLLIILSGPEPQRTILEEILVLQLKNYHKKVMMIRGVFTNNKLSLAQSNITIVNHMLTKELQQVINESKLVLARSGYTTVLDLSKLAKKAFFIPTPGQFEQEYLAERMQEQLIAPFVTQENFELDLLDNIQEYNGFTGLKSVFNTDLFNLF